MSHKRRADFYLYADVKKWAEVHEKELLYEPKPSLKIDAGKLRRVKASICRAAFCFSMLSVFCIVGGMERDYIGIASGTALCVISFITAIITGRKGGVFR